MTLTRVLIANRGEIAIRVARACREAGIGSVAVYSDADAGALHVQAADRAVRIGPASPSESYLSIPALLDAARSSGADAIHPGYGFLSENAAFARACEAAGLVFVGPPAAVIERMGSKIGARELMQGAGVPVVPGVTPADQSDAGVLTAARTVGFPALVKASAGGGGKGMRILGDEAGARELIPAARREAAAAFGDGTLYVERLIEQPRHVEIQVFGDRHGNVVHLFERECSIQRRHQKVIEESPSPGLTPRVRAAMGDAAVAAARAAGYRNAGTIEFLLEGAGDDARFYFLEMNTRLQVEHPVTEAVTGVDLVRAQLLVAAGGALPWSQDTLVQRGHAIECRVYAEDPADGFLPQAGPLLLYREPQGPGVRVDSGVAEGSDVSVHYDPLLAKLTVSAESRAAAIDRALAALRAYPVLGIRTNIPFMIRVLDHPAFRGGHLHTGFIDAHLETLLARRRVPEEALAAAALVTAALVTAATAASGTAGDAAAAAPDPWTSGQGLGTIMATLTLILRDGDDEHRVTMAAGGVVSADGKDAIAARRTGPGSFRVGYARVGDAPVRTAWAAAAGDARWVFLDGEVYELEVQPEGRRRRTSGHAGSLSASMPATVIRVQVGVGDAVKRGDTLVILEAMKMELPVRAPADGTVKAVHCRQGDLVQPGVPLIEMA